MSNSSLPSENRLAAGPPKGVLPRTSSYRVRNCLPLICASVALVSLNAHGVPAWIRHNAHLELSKCDLDGVDRR